VTATVAVGTEVASSVRRLRRERDQRDPAHDHGGRDDHPQRERLAREREINWLEELKQRVPKH
jgi:hypothetical protein